MSTVSLYLNLFVCDTQLTMDPMTHVERWQYFECTHILTVSPSYCLHFLFDISIYLAKSVGCLLLLLTHRQDNEPHFIRYVYYVLNQNLARLPTHQKIALLLINCYISLYWHRKCHAVGSWQCQKIRTNFDGSCEPLFSRTKTHLYSSVWAFVILHLMLSAVATWYALPVGIECVRWYDHKKNKATDTK